jgi:hypothetical protein
LFLVLVVAFHATRRGGPWECVVSRVRNPFAFWIGVLLTLPLSYFLVDRIDFAWSSRTEVGSVVEISARNSTCSKSRYDCTVFKAKVRYRVGEDLRRFWISAGTARDHNRSKGEANLHVNQLVPVVYDVRNPARVYRDTFWEVWGPPFLTLVFQLAMFMVALQEGHRGWRR